MNDTTKTVALALIAIIMGILAFKAAPTVPAPEIFNDQGQPFFDAFDPTLCASLEVIAYDEEKATMEPFKVALKDGVWIIPSHHDYPADAKDRLAKTANIVMGIQKDQLRSIKSQDFESFGVVDPLNEAGLKGNGTRITLRDKSGRTLADLVIGKLVEDKPGFYYARMPNAKRTYAVKLDASDISTRFADWILTDLLNLDFREIQEVVLNNYSINEATGTLDHPETVELVQDNDNNWAMRDLQPEKESFKKDKANELARAIAAFSIVGVRPKPASLSQDLRTTENVSLDLPTILSLEQKGFFVAHDGRLLSNEGEILVMTEDGLEYTLRFGEMLFGSGERISSGIDEDAPIAADNANKDASENRYLFVTAQFNPDLLGKEPQPPAKVAPEKTQETAAGGDGKAATPETSKEDEDIQAEAFKTEHAKWEKKIEDGRKKAQALSDRFADWYYVISGESFNKVRLKRSDLVGPLEKDDIENDAPALPGQP